MAPESPSPGDRPTTAGRVTSQPRDRIGVVDPKPELTLLAGDLYDVDAIVAFYTKLTGRTPTPEEIEEVRVELSKVRDGDA